MKVYVYLLDEQMSIEKIDLIWTNHAGKIEEMFAYICEYIKVRENGDESDKTQYIQVIKNKFKNLEPDGRGVLWNIHKIDY